MARFYKKKHFQHSQNRNFGNRHVQIFDLDFVSFKRRRQEQQQPLKGFTKHQRHKAYKHPIFGQNSKRIYYVGINKKSQI